MERNEFPRHGLIGGALNITIPDHLAFDVRSGTAHGVAEIDENGCIIGFTIHHETNLGAAMSKRTARNTILTAVVEITRANGGEIPFKLHVPTNLYREAFEFDTGVGIGGVLIEPTDNPIRVELGRISGVCMAQSSVAPQPEYNGITAALCRSIADALDKLEGDSLCPTQ